MTYHDDVVARDKMVRVRYESISSRKTQQEVLLTAVGSAMAMGKIRGL
jgi:hypothetical protein